jgi:hypothetical protein
MAKFNGNVKNQLQLQKSMAMSKINYNCKNQLQLQKSIAILNFDIAIAIEFCHCH